MKAEYKIKKQLLLEAIKDKNFCYLKPLHCEDDVKVAWALFEEQSDGVYWEYLDNFRCSGEESNIKCEDWSRHYDSESVYRRLDDGSFVGWVYWFGGGKHGEPESIDWIEDAYNLNVVSVKQVPEYIFEKGD